MSRNNAIGVNIQIRNISRWSFSDNCSDNAAVSIEIHRNFWIARVGYARKCVGPGTCSTSGRRSVRSVINHHPYIWCSSITGRRTEWCYTIVRVDYTRNSNGIRTVIEAHRTWITIVCVKSLTIQISCS